MKKRILITTAFIIVTTIAITGISIAQNAIGENLILMKRDVSIPLSDYAPQNLKATISGEGFISLSWETPLAQIPLSYKIYRGETPLAYSPIAILNNPYATSYVDYSAAQGAFYYYAVQALYPTNRSDNFANISIDYQVKSGEIEFTTEPLITAKINEIYDYDFNFTAKNPDHIEFRLLGNAPDSMVINQADGRLYWVPRERGLYPVTILAEDVITHARAVQEFEIRVADKTGSIAGSIQDELQQPVENAIVRLYQIGNGTSYCYEVRSGADGRFILDNVQAGQSGNVSKIYAYIQSPVAGLASQWFINGSKLIDASEKNLEEGGTLQFDVILHPNLENRTIVRGLVLDSFGLPISDAHISFIAKSNFLHIGDTTNRNNPFFYSLHPDSKLHVEAKIQSDNEGNFSISLPIGKQYYIRCEKQGFISAYHPNQRNVLESKALTIDTQSPEIVFNLKPILPNGTGSITGRVVRMDNNVRTPSIVVAIATPIKRGAGGHNEFFPGETDSNGVFVFKDLPDSSRYIVLALPIGEAGPLYFSPAGGTNDWQASSEIQVNGDVQDINISVHPTTNKGIGSIWGQVTTVEDLRVKPVAGSIVTAYKQYTNEIAGYAITDAAGFYSISALPPNSYKLMVDKVGYLSMTASHRNLNYTESKSLERSQQVDFSIALKIVDVPKENIPSTGALLYQNYPNPFSAGTSGATKIQYYLATHSKVTLKVFSLLGKEVATLDEGLRPEGMQSVSFNPRNIPSGVYIYQLVVDGQVLSRQMLFVK